MMTRQVYIDIAKALCIILVIIGHFNPSWAPLSWQYVVKGIYSFHMPAFMFLSGLLYSLSYHTGETYLPFMTRKVKRLYVPYISASIVIIAIKLLTQSFLPVKNTAYAADLLHMFWYPSAAVHLWFCLTLLCTFAIVRIIGNSRIPMCILLLISILLWFLPVQFPPVFSLDHLPRMLVFFACGTLVGQLELSDSEFTLPKWTLWAIVVAFVFAEIGYLIVDKDVKLLSALTAILGIASVIVVSKYLESTKVSRFLSEMGECSFFIYLFHTTFMEFAKALLPKVGFSIQQYFSLTLVIAIVAGLACPLLLQKLIVEKSKILSFIFGVPKKAS